MLVRVTVAGRVGIEAAGVHTGEAGLGRLGRLALAYLVCERHRPVARDELADVLWGEDLPASWEQLIRGLTSKMRATLSHAGLDPAISLTSALGAYQIHLPAGAVLDVEEAADALEAAAAALARGDAAGARCRASGAVAVASRQFLPAAKGTWVERKQAELRELHLRALEVVARATAADGLWGESIDAAEGAIAIEPFRESAYLALMDAHAGAGSRGEAMRAYERCRRVLAEELGVAPSPQTEAAFLALLGDEPAAVSETPPVPLPAALAPFPGGFLVGRETECERLGDALKRTTVEGRQAVFVGGEPGIGKSTLVAAFARDAHLQGARVLFGRCDEELGLSYQPFAEALSGFITAAPQVELAAHVAAHGGELARLAPELTQRLPDTPVPPVTDPESDRYRLFGAITALLAGAAAGGPVVLILEDLHWAAPPTLVLLRHLLRSTTASPMLLVGTYRHTDIGPDHPLTQSLADLHREPAVDRFVLGGLDQAGVASFVRAAGAGEEGGDVALVTALHAQTSGNPFFVGQLLRHLGETGATYRREGSWTYYAGTDGPGIPEGVRELVGRRLHRLSEPARNALRWGSVVGTEFTLALLERVSGSGRADAMLDAVDEAVGAHLVVERGSGRYGFAHALVRGAIYAELSLTRRAQWHRRVAESLEALPVDDAHRLPALVHHFAAAATAGGATKAADHAMAAAGQAFAQSAWEDAVAFLERGLEALAVDDSADLERRCDLLLMVAETWIRFFDIRRARSAATEAVATAELLGDAERLATAVRWNLTALAGPNPAAVAIAEETVTALGDDRPDLRAILLARLALLKTTGDEVSSEALELARQSGSPEALGVALRARSGTLAGTPRARERLAMAEELVSAAPVEAWDGWRAGYQERAAARIVMGDRLGFEADAAACERMGRERRFWYFQGVAALWRGTSALLDGRFEEVETLLEEFCAVQTAATGATMQDQVQGIQLGRLALDRGQLHEAKAILMPWPPHPVLGPMLASVHAQLGESEAARRAVDRWTADDFRALGVLLPPGLAYLTEAVVHLGDGGEAPRIYDRFSPFAGQMVAAGAVAHCPGSVDRYLGQLTAILGRFDSAESHFEVALRMEDGMRSPPLLARTRFWYAHMLRERGTPADIARARDLLEDSYSTAERLGMADLARQAEELMTRL